MAPVTITKAVGLNTQPNELETPAGSLAVAENVVISRDGVIEVARGFEDYSTNLPDFTPAQLISIGGTAYLHLDNGLWYNSSGTWYRKRGAFAANSATMFWAVVSGSHLYYIAQWCVFDLNLATGLVSVLAGRVYTPGTTDGTGAAARFNYPRSITTDGTSLYVLEGYNGVSGGSCIRKVTITTGAVITIAGDPTATGTADGTGTAAKFNDVIGGGITYLGGSLYVCDNEAVRRVSGWTTANTGVVTTIAGSIGVSAYSDGTGTAAKFNWLSGITSYGSDLYVTDRVNGTVRKVSGWTTANTGVVTTLAGTHSGGSFADGTGTGASFVEPFGVVALGSSLYVSDRTRIRKVANWSTANTGVVTTIAGAASGSADGIGTAAGFVTARGLCTDGTDLYIPDTGTTSMRKLYLSTGYVSTILGITNSAGVGSSGHADGIIVGPS